MAVSDGHGGGVRAGPRPGARGPRSAPGPRRTRHSHRGSLRRLQGTAAGEGRTDRAGFLLGPPTPRFRGVGQGLAAAGTLGLLVDRGDWRFVSTQPPAAGSPRPAAGLRATRWRTP